MKIIQKLKTNAKVPFLEYLKCSQNSYSALDQFSSLINPLKNSNCQYYRKSVDEAPYLALVTFCNKLVRNNLSLLLSARLHYICLVYPDILRRKEILL